MLKKVTSSDLKVKMFLDGVAISFVKECIDLFGPLVKGYTTNPSLMKKAGITNYKEFAVDFIKVVPPGSSISFEVLADDLEKMEEQAREISSWNENVYVKIPVTTTSGISTAKVIKRLSRDGVKVNITAIFTLQQIEELLPCVIPGPSSYLSIFAGRIADTGVDPVPLLKKAAEMIKDYKNIELLWASTREPINVLQAEQSGCHIICMSWEIFKKLKLFGKDLQEYSVETVKTFIEDATGINL